MTNQNKVLTFEGANIIFRNFEGKKSEFNKSGKRSFSVLIEDEERALCLRDDGWNVKEIKPRNDDDPIIYRLEVNVNFEGFKPPVIHMVSEANDGKIRKVLLDSDTVKCLDYADIVKNGCDLVIRPYDWNVNGRSGISAYLQTAYINILPDPFADKYED